MTATVLAFPGVDLSKVRARRPPKDPRAPNPKLQAMLMAQRRAAIVRHHAAKRRAARLQRTTPWADLVAIQAVYDRAQRLSLETGIPHHVDHVLPLQGRLVSGLHVHTNLQILTGAENSRKRNRYEVQP